MGKIKLKTKICKECYQNFETNTDIIVCKECYIKIRKRINEKQLQNSNSIKL